MDSTVLKFHIQVPHEKIADTHFFMSKLCPVFRNVPLEAKEGRALTGFSGPPKSQKIKVSVQHCILHVLIDEWSRCRNLILI